MNVEGIVYRRGYKYQLARDYRVQTGIKGHEASAQYIRLDGDGTLTIKKGYAWDGPSGPTIDTKNFMRGSLVHDALYQLIREGKIPLELRGKADAILKEICRKDGMSSARAWIVYHAVRRYGFSSILPSGGKKIEVAP